MAQPLTEEGRRFRVNEIDKYKKENDTFNRRKYFFAAVFALGIFISAFYGTASVATAATIAATGSLATNIGLGGIIYNIAKKTSNKKHIKNYQAELDANEEIETSNNTIKAKVFKKINKYAKKVADYTASL